ncbi:hypothetical protein AYI69_g8197 [Smittium culicis]|uniref:Reverse transcriptase domain-containing protein n=1 Tax=Smittium culicis TaxID=133412 RepID=A0A1R1XLC8_9FUNG|nr:hypothetical protein AYI69_g8197 [Smittium culicis]
MIKGMYDVPKIAARVGNDVSNPTEYLCGVRKGIPGLLFADDDVLYGESSADLHTALNTINRMAAHLRNGRELLQGQNFNTIDY